MLHDQKSTFRYSNLEFLSQILAETLSMYFLCQNPQMTGFFLSNIQSFLMASSAYFFLLFLNLPKYLSC